MKTDKESQITNKPSIQGVTGDRKRERIFELSLPALVKGKNAFGKSFEEKAEIKSISAQEAHLFLRTPVQIGNELKLTLNIPATFMLVHPIKMELFGQVSRVEMRKLGRNKLQLVIIDLESRYHIWPETPDLNLSC